MNKSLISLLFILLAVTAVDTQARSGGQSGMQGRVEHRGGQGSG